MIDRAALAEFNAGVERARLAYREHVQRRGLCNWHGVMGLSEGEACERMARKVNPGLCARHKTKYDGIKLRRARMREAGL